MSSHRGLEGRGRPHRHCLEEAGGQITAMYPQQAIFDVAGFPAIRGRELAEQLVTRATPGAPTPIA